MMSIAFREKQIKPQGDLTAMRKIRLNSHHDLCEKDRQYEVWARMRSNWNSLTLLVEL